MSDVVERGSGRGSSRPAHTTTRPKKHQQKQTNKIEQAQAKIHDLIGPPPRFKHVALHFTTQMYNRPGPKRFPVGDPKIKAPLRLTTSARPSKAMIRGCQLENSQNNKTSQDVSSPRSSRCLGACMDKKVQRRHAVLGDTLEHPRTRRHPKTSPRPLHLPYTTGPKRRCPFRIPFRRSRPSTAPLRPRAKARFLTLLPGPGTPPVPRGRVSKESERDKRARLNRVQSGLGVRWPARMFKHSLA